MAVLPIYVLGSPILRKETVAVTTVTPELVQLAEDMFETMHAASGVGLAAPQVGRTERLAVVEADGHRHVLINPEIVSKEGEITWEEGCLSIPEVYGDVARAAKVVVRATGLDGKTFEVEGSELFGVCMQHEIDHLSFLKKRKAMKAWDEEKVKYPDLIRILLPGAPGDPHEGDGAERL